MSDRYMKYTEIKAYGKPIDISKNNPYIETFNDSYEGLKVWCTRVPGECDYNYIKLYINDSLNFIYLDANNSEFELREINIHKVRIEVDALMDIAKVNLVLFR